MPITIVYADGRVGFDVKIVRKLILSVSCITFLILLVCGSAAKQQSTPKKKTPSLTTEDVQTDTPNAATIADALTLDDVMTKLDKVSSFRLNADSIQGSTSYKRKFEFCQPDRIRGTIDIHVQAGGPDEEIIVGDSLYIKDSQTGVWTKTASHLAGSAVRQFLSSQLNWLFNYPLKKAGMDEVNGVQSVIYKKEETASNHGVTWTIRATIWVGISDGLPVQIEVNNPGDAGSMIYTFFDYNQPIKIEPPM
ncbi:MAG TPA: hypothetical protein VFC63_17925 [Blastocatellia bacterium]|nr:hypothetical protein [Blastocatellia bacterium]